MLPSPFFYHVVYVLKKQFRKIYMHAGLMQNLVKVYEKWRIASLLQNVLSSLAFHTCARKNRKEYITGPRHWIAVLWKNLFDFQETLERPKISSLQIPKSSQEELKIPAAYWLCSFIVFHFLLQYFAFPHTLSVLALCLAGVRHSRTVDFYIFRCMQ